MKNVIITRNNNRNITLDSFHLACYTKILSTVPSPTSLSHRLYLNSMPGKSISASDEVAKLRGERRQVENEPAKSHATETDFKEAVISSLGTIARITSND